MQWMDEVTTWMAIHPVRVDLLVLTVVAGTIVYILRRQRKHRRILHRKVWGMYLKRKDRNKYQLMKFEDAITDVALEMVHQGDMTEEQEKMWYNFFAVSCEMKGLKPGRDQASIKRGIRTRLKYWAKRKIIIPGDPPGVKVDPTYEGTAKLKSKYVRE